MGKVAQWKIEKVQELKDIMLKHKAVGIARVTGIPAPQLQVMRASLRDQISIVVSRNNLIGLALAEAAKEKQGIEELAKLLEGPSAIIASDLNPFKLFQCFERTKTPAPAKGGEIAPEDIVVKEGETPFRPGPVVGDLQQAGLPAAIEGGKVVIKKDTVLVRKGEKIPKLVAQVLTRLGIYPLTVGLDVRGVHEDGAVYPKNVLSVDISEYVENIKLAVTQAFNLSLNSGYPTPLTIGPMLASAHMDAMNLALYCSYPTRETIPVLLSKASAQMRTLSSLLQTPTEEAEEKREDQEEGGEKEEAKDDAEEKAASTIGTLFGSEEE